jgi:hypothetical protein
MLISVMAVDGFRRVTVPAGGRGGRGGGRRGDEMRERGVEWGRIG